ncbi:MAG: lysophospholipid acyltransferase family protein [Candidatus Hodarchaeota archaeon]
MTVKGTKSYSWRKPAIVIGNHTSKQDFYVSAAAAARYGRIIRGLVHNTDWKDPVYRVQMTYLQMIPRMGSGDEIIKRMVRALHENKMIGIAPEGTFSRTGLVMEPFTGFLRVYFEANKDGYKVPLIPAFVKGISQAYPMKDGNFAKKNLPRKVKITAFMGKPFHLKIPEKIDKDILRKYANHVMLKIARMGGQKRLRPNPVLEKLRKEGNEKRHYEVIDGVEDLL